MAAKKRWSQEDDRRLKELMNREDLKVSDVATQMGASRNQVMRRTKVLGIERGRHGEWSDEEVAYLTEKMLTHGIAGCVEHLGKTWESVRLKSRRLGLRRSPDAVRNRDYRALRGFFG
jgi:AraC-like DNA-binding protein